MLRIDVGDSEITVSASFFILVTLMLIISEGKAALISLFSSLAHELGHVLLMLIFGEKIRRFSVSCIGFKIEICDSTALSLEKETAVSLAGVFVNFAISVFSFIFYRLCGMRFLLELCLINTAVACFNLLPIDCLDGGRALYYTVLKKFSEDKAQKIIDITTTVTVVLLMCILIFVSFYIRFNFTFVIAFIYMIILTINRFIRLK